MLTLINVLYRKLEISNTNSFFKPFVTYADPCVPVKFLKNILLSYSFKDRNTRINTPSILFQNLIKPFF